MELSLASVDRLEHFMWSSVIMGWYYSRVGKLTPAHSMSTSEPRPVFNLRLQHGDAGELT